MLGCVLFFFFALVFCAFVLRIITYSELLVIVLSHFAYFVLVTCKLYALLIPLSLTTNLFIQKKKEEIITWNWKTY